ncbi:MAG: sugar phosphate isomerase/epimerase [Kiritimatiellae bacterium]|nr:sugar phosphate isomerase/epimerase [Kiritimatiellia bacterium]MDD5521557.1 sugar phosphate isomerase/epimerase [Kiritimatiellia bacterium]
MSYSCKLSRREFLTRSGVALAGLCITNQALPGRAADNVPGIRFAVRGPFKTKSIRERALLLKKLGYHGIELGGDLLNRPLDAIMSELDGTGIAVSAMSGSMQLLDPDPGIRAQSIERGRQRLEMAKTLGALGIIVVPTFGACRFPDQADTPSPHKKEDQLLVEGLKQLIPDVKRTGVMIFLEPLTKKETHFMNLQSHGARIIDETGGENIKLLSDFYHMQMEEKDIAVTLTQYGKYTGYVHMADGVKRTEPGSLPFDYRPGFKALKKAGYSGWLTVESSATDNPEAALTRALKYVQQQWQEA